MLTDIRRNPLVLTDAYNLYHGDLKCNVDWEVSHLYNRKADMVLFGFEELVTSFFTVRITDAMIDEAVQCAAGFGLGFPAESMFRAVVNDLNGHLPLRIQALSEGTWCPAGTPFAQIRNTVEGYGELVTWWEGVLMHSYFASSCATEALAMRQYLLQQSPDCDNLKRFHSFGFRGHKSLEDAYWASSAWSLFLPGSCDFHVGYHHPDCGASSIVALAHKVTQQFDSEYECFERAVWVAHRAGQKVVALVIDTYDADTVIRQYVVPLAKLAKGLEMSITFRPDSGDTRQQALDIWEQTQLHSIDNIRVLLGEGMSFAAVKEADAFFLCHHIPLSFICYGIGAGFYKTIERDTLGFAMKTAYSNGKPRMKFSENPLKRSIPGAVQLVFTGTNLMVCQEDETLHSMYRDVYVFTTVLKHYTVCEPTPYLKIRENALESVQKHRGARIELCDGIKQSIAAFAEQYSIR
jgi:nicotinic acid phosphoribosyltransferase